MNAGPAIPVVEATGLKRHYRLPRDSLFRPPELVKAVDGVDFVIQRGRSFGVVGESGSGKSTLARLIMALDTPTAGTVRINGADPHSLPAAELQAMRRDFQMVFQDPYGSLDPRHKVGRIVAEPLDALLSGIDQAARARRIVETLESVGLRAADGDKYPHEFSGGQRQRIAIARALITQPALIVADEPVSALDVSVQAQVLNLMKDLQAEFGVTYMLISHDLSVVEYVCDEVAVMYRGRIVEQAPTAELFRAPRHDYTRALLDAVPQIGRGRRRDRLRAANITGPET